jgi:hypothetical protein
LRGVGGFGQIELTDGDESAKFYVGSEEYKAFFVNVPPSSTVTCKTDAAAPDADIGNLAQVSIAIFVGGCIHTVGASVETVTVESSCHLSEAQIRLNAN